MDVPGTKNNLFSIPLCQHGREVLKTLRTLENTVRKYARWINHRTFNIKCAKAKIIPISVKLATNIPGVKAEKVLAKAERQLLDIRIRQSTYTVNQLKKKTEELKASLFSTVSNHIKTEIEKLIEQAHKRESEETKSRQQRKFNSLLEKQRKQETPRHPQDTIDTDRWVINNSRRVL